MPKLPPNPYLLISQITDPFIRKNFEQLVKYFAEQNQLLGFVFFDLSFSKAKTGITIAHGLPYIPLDVIVTRITGSGEVTFDYGKFDEENLVIDVTGPCRIRFFVGTCAKVDSSVETADEDAQKFASGV